MEEIKVAPKGVGIFEHVLEPDFCTYIIEKYTHLKPDFRNYDEWGEYIIKDSAEVLINNLAVEDTDFVVKAINAVTSFPNISHVYLYRWPYRSYIPQHNDSYHNGGASIYLNREWEANDGGFLLYQTPDSEWQSVTPFQGRMVVMQEDIEHITTPNTNPTRIRYSCQIWRNVDK